MIRTARYKLQYVIVLVAGFALAGVVAWSFRGPTIALFLVPALLLIPGRLSGFLWRDLYRGRRLIDAGHLEAGVTAHQRFLQLLAERPRRRRLWWLAWGVYSRDPGAMAHNNIGAAQLHLGRFEEAESAFREALAADPEYPIPHFNLAVLSTARGEHAEAKKHADAAVALGYSRNLDDKILQSAGAVLARIEGRGSGVRASEPDR